MLLLPQDAGEDVISPGLPELRTRLAAREPEQMEALPHRFFLKSIRVKSVVRSISRINLVSDAGRDLSLRLHQQDGPQILLIWS